MSTGCGCGCDSGTCSCGCCEGIRAIAPRTIYNRPGLSSVEWRVGRYGDFFDTLLAAIATTPVDVETDRLGAHGRFLVDRIFPLSALQTRASDDPTIALLDLWSVAGDIISFYTERIANEGYRRTATEMRSVLELARLVGYRRRPGVAASVYLAFTADETWKGTRPQIVAPGARVQSLPEPGQSPQFFETDMPLTVRYQWNLLTARQARPLSLPFENAAGHTRKSVGTLYFEGTATNLSVGSALLLIYGDGPQEQVLRMVATVTPDFSMNVTRVDLTDAGPVRQITWVPVDLNTLVTELERRPSIPPANATRLGVTAAQAFGPGSAATDALITTFHPYAASSFFIARRNAVATGPPILQAIDAMRVKASVYAGTAPLPPPPPVAIELRERTEALSPADWPFDPQDTSLRTPNIIDLDATYDAILSGTWVVIERHRDGETWQIITRVSQVDTVSLTAYNFPARVTRLTLADPWLDDHDTGLASIRSTTVYAAPDMLQPADVPIDDPVCGAEIELEGEVDGLEPGRWLIITGNRAVTSSPNLGDAAAGDSFSVPDVPVSELVMLLSVRQDTLYIDDTGTIVSPAAVGDTSQLIPLPGDSIHTFLTLSAPLSYCYQRDTVQIYANVAHATHGQTWREVLGSGNAAAGFQRFTLKNAPLTYTAADNPSGVESSLNVYVNEVRWHEVDNLLDMGPADHDYLTDADAEEKTGVTAGDGRNGARLPTGTENVRAVYRSGIGIPGNVQAGQISLLVSGTDGLKSVINPQPATGGADPEGLESTRARIPLAVSALDRLVATADYAEFARLFAGIGKAASVRLPSSHGQMVQVTIAGQDDIPIDESSDLYRNLLAALEDYGDPYLPVSLARRELLLLVIAARVKLNSDYVWETVEPQIRAGLAGVFGFDARDLAQSAYAAEAMAAMASVPGVEYAALDLFAAVSEDTPPSQLASLGTTLSGVADRIAAAPGRIDPVTRTAKPAQLLILDPAIPTTLLLTEVPQ